MLVFNEGVPRAGKSYDAVRSHILPTLKKRRRVFARLNGLDHARIARYLDMPESEILELLVLVDTKEVKTLFACVQDETGKWCIPDQFKDSLVVIDEVHEFYVNQRLPLPPEIENFWALLGQNGGDAVIMTQWINRVHQAIRARIERKNVFQKLTAVGLKNRYRVTYYHTTSPGKYERVGGKTESYDPAIYPLYHGYAPGSENTEVYEEGGTNIWRAMAFRGALFGIAGLIGAYFFISFFFPHGKKKEPEKPVAVAAAKPQTEANAASAKVGDSAAPKLEDPYRDLTPDQRFVVELEKRGRVRLQAKAEMNGHVRGWVEWVNDQGETVEELEVTALNQLGWRSRWTLYGLRLSAGGHVIIATQWPREQPVRDKDQRLYNLSPDGGHGSASAASASGADDPGGVIGYKAGQRGDVFPRSPGYPMNSRYTTGPTPTTL